MLVRDVKMPVSVVDLQCFLLSKFEWAISLPQIQTATIVPDSVYICWLNQYIICDRLDQRMCADKSAKMIAHCIYVANLSLIQI